MHLPLFWIFSKATVVAQKSLCMNYRPQKSRNIIQLQKAPSWHCSSNIQTLNIENTFQHPVKMVFIFNEWRATLCLFCMTSFFLVQFPSPFLSSRRAQAHLYTFTSFVSFNRSSLDIDKETECRLSFPSSSTHFCPYIPVHRFYDNQRKPQWY